MSNTIPMSNEGDAPNRPSHPDEVLRDPSLSLAQKKKLLASWVSDARAVDDAPTLRRLDDGTVVEARHILRALASLDDKAARDSRAARHEGLVIRFPWTRRGKSSNDNDDDPPPAPAGIAVPFRPSSLVARARPATMPATACAAG